MELKRIRKGSQESRTWVFLTFSSIHILKLTPYEPSLYSFQQFNPEPSFPDNSNIIKVPFPQGGPI
jgi:hypothetical protein